MAQHGEMVEQEALPKPAEALFLAKYRSIFIISRLSAKRVNAATEHINNSIQKQVQSILHRWQRSKREKEFDTSIITNGEANLRKAYYHMLIVHLQTYDYGRHKRQYDSYGEWDRFNQLLNASAPEYRTFVMNLYQFDPVPDGYILHPKYGWMQVSHPTMPEMDFVDVARAHIQELCKQLWILNIRVSQMMYYVNQLMDLLMPYLDWLYTGGTSGVRRSDRQFDDFKLMDKALQQVIGRAKHSTKTTNYTSRVTESTEHIDREISSIMQQAAPKLKQLGLDKYITDSFYGRLRYKISVSRKRYGTVLHEDLLQGYPHPFALNQIITYGNQLLDRPTKYLVAAEVPLPGDLSGKADLIIFVQDNDYWKPVILLDIKTRVGIEWDIRPKKVGDDRVPEPTTKQQYLTKSEWQAMLHEDPKIHRRQLDSYAKAICYEYQQITGESIELITGIIHVARQQSVPRARLGAFFKGIIASLPDTLRKGVRGDILVPKRRVRIGISMLARPAATVKSLYGFEVKPYVRKLAQGGHLNLYCPIASNINYGKSAAIISALEYLMYREPYIESFDDLTDLGEGIRWVTILDFRHHFDQFRSLRLPKPIRDPGDEDLSPEIFTINVPYDDPMGFLENLELDSQDDVIIVYGWDIYQHVYEDIASDIQHWLKQQSSMYNIWVIGSVPISSCTDTRYWMRKTPVPTRHWMKLYGYSTIIFDVPLTPKQKKMPAADNIRILYNPETEQCRVIEVKNLRGIAKRFGHQPRHYPRSMLGKGPLRDYTEDVIEETAKKFLMQELEDPFVPIPLKAITRLKVENQPVITYIGTLVKITAPIRSYQFEQHDQRLRTHHIPTFRNFSKDIQYPELQLFNEVKSIVASNKFIQSLLESGDSYTQIISNPAAVLQTFDAIVTAIHNTYFRYDKLTAFKEHQRWLMLLLLRHLKGTIGYDRLYSYYLRFASLLKYSLGYSTTTRYIFNLAIIDRQIARFIANQPEPTVSWMYGTLYRVDDRVLIYVSAELSMTTNYDEIKGWEAKTIYNSNSQYVLEKLGDLVEKQRRYDEAEEEEWDEELATLEMNQLAMVDIDGHKHLYIRDPNWKHIGQVFFDMTDLTYMAIRSMRLVKSTMPTSRPSSATESKWIKIHDFMQDVSRELTYSHASVSSADGQYQLKLDDGFGSTLWEYWFDDLGSIVRALFFGTRPKFGYMTRYTRYIIGKEVDFTESGDPVDLAFRKLLYDHDFTDIGFQSLLEAANDNEEDRATRVEHRPDKCPLIIGHVSFYDSTQGRPRTIYGRTDWEKWRVNLQHDRCFWLTNVEDLLDEDDRLLTADGLYYRYANPIIDILGVKYKLIFDYSFDLNDPIGKAERAVLLEGKRLRDLHVEITKNEYVPRLDPLSYTMVDHYYVTRIDYNNGSKSAANGFIIYTIDVGDKLTWHPEYKDWYVEYDCRYTMLINQTLELHETLQSECQHLLDPYLELVSEDEELVEYIQECQSSMKLDETTGTLNNIRRMVVKALESDGTLSFDDKSALEKARQDPIYIQFLSKQVDLASLIHAYHTLNPMEFVRGHLKSCTEHPNVIVPDEIDDDEED